MYVYENTQHTYYYEWEGDLSDDEVVRLIENGELQPTGESEFVTTRGWQEPASEFVTTRGWQEPAGYRDADA